MRIRALFCIGLLFVGCVGDAPTTSENISSNSGSADAGSDFGTDVAFGSPCATTENCGEGLECLSLAGTSVCTQGCTADADCASGVCVAETCWPEATCAAGGTSVGSECVYTNSCQQIIEGDDSSPTGHYVIKPDGGPELRVWCEMSNGNAGLTIYRSVSDSLSTDVESHVAACQELGLEPIVPPNRAMMRAIIDYVGSPPPVVNVYPGAILPETRLDQFDGRCNGEECGFFLSNEADGSCSDGKLSDEKDEGPLRLSTPACEFGTWAPSGEVITSEFTVCSTNDFSPPLYKNCWEVMQDDAVMNSDTGGTSGLYRFTRRNSDVEYYAFCDMEWEGGGWTLTGKVNGETGIGAYADEGFWTSPVAMAPLTPGTAATENRTWAFQDAPATQVRVSFMEPQVGFLAPVADVIVPFETNSLLETFTGDDNQIVTNMTAEDWLDAGEGSFGLQSECNRIGFNLRSDGDANHSVRVGILGDDDIACATPDSSLGVGILDGNQTLSAITAGNAGASSPNKAYWVGLWVRSVEPAEDCDALAENGVYVDGTYPVRDGESVANTSCTF